MQQSGGVMARPSIGRFVHALRPSTQVPTEGAGEPCRITYQRSASFPIVDYDYARMPGRGRRKRAVRVANPVRIFLFTNEIWVELSSAADPIQAALKNLG